MEGSNETPYEPPSNLGISSDSAEKPLVEHPSQNCLASKRKECMSSWNWNNQTSAHSSFKNSQLCATAERMRGGILISTPRRLFDGFSWPMSILDAQSTYVEALAWNLGRVIYWQHIANHVIDGKGYHRADNSVIFTPHFAESFASTLKLACGIFRLAAQISSHNFSLGSWN